MTNVIENKYCSGCSYPLSPLAFEEIKAAENMKIQVLEKKYEQDMKYVNLNAALSDTLHSVPINALAPASKNCVAQLLISVSENP